MNTLNKSDVTCRICHMVLRDPIQLPCFCTICKEHISDNTVKDGLIKCDPCGDDFRVIDIKVKENTVLKKVLEAEHHLSNQEKEAKKEIHDKINQFHQLYDQFIDNSKNFDLICHEHFAEIQRLIDIQREELKAQIDEIALDMIKKTIETEQIYRNKFAEIQNIQEFDFEMERNSLENDFRSIHLKIESIQALKVKNEEGIKHLLVKINALKSINNKLRNCEFKVNKEHFIKSNFGDLILNCLNKKLISSSYDKTLKIWDLDSNECIRTLTGHTEEVLCVEKLSNGQFISSSNDKTLKIWDSDSGSLVKTLFCTNKKIFCLKFISATTIAVGCSKTIKILNVDDDVCIKILEGHTDCVRDLITLPNGTLISCSQDETIKFWNLNDSRCIKTLNGHTGSVRCLLLLSNGQLASGSKDKTIKIWNISTGDCINTFEGHTGSILGLESTDNFELISCSSDKTIKIWNVNTGECLNTLVDHVKGITCIKHYFGDVLLSSSVDETIKIWNLTDGICTHTLTDHYDIIPNLIII
jgi:WD40 repeat protein